MIIKNRLQKLLLILIFSFYVYSFTGLITFYEYNYLPVNLLLESTIFLIFILGFKTPSATNGVYFVIFFTYVFICYIIACYINQANFLDFLQAYKAYIYVVILALCSGRDLIRIDVLRKLFVFLIFVFLFKYFYSFLLNLTPRMGERPGIFVENNFELLLLISFFYVLKIRNEVDFRYFVFLSVIVVLSKSKSAALMLFLVFIFSYIDCKKINIKYFVVVFPIIALIVACVFNSRIESSFYEIDRFKFFMHFLYEIRNWTVCNYLFGTMPITPLSIETCDSLSSYSDLYSYSGEYICYSVILHSYLLRVIFDHGIVGFFVLCSFYWHVFRSSSYSIKNSACLLSVFVVSGLSVSSFNSVFVASTSLIILNIKSWDFSRVINPSIK